MINQEVEQQMKQEVATTRTQILQMTVKDEASMYQAEEVLSGLKSKIKEREEFFAPIVDSAYKAHRTATAKRDEILKPMKECYDSLRNKVAGFIHEQEQKRQEAERKALADAAAKEEAKRKELEAKAQAELEKGNTAKAEALLEKAENVVVLPKTVAPAPVASKTSVTYAVDVIVENPALVPDLYKVVDESMLRKSFTASKYQLQVPGVRFVKRPVGSVRS